MDVEVDISSGLPSFATVGLPNGAVREGRERIGAALTNSGFEFPLRRITVNLLPAALPKHGSGFDLAIAAALLAGCETVQESSYAELAGIPTGGFVTDEIRRGGHREGFAVQTVAGQRGVLAHVELPGPPRVGRYGVDLPAFERVALPAMAAPQPVGVVVVDELGRMELASAAFRDAMSDLLDREVAVVATVHVHRHPFTDALKRRPDLRVIRVTERSRDALPERLAAELVAAGAARRRQ